MRNLPSVARAFFMEQFEQKPVPEIGVLTNLTTTEKGSVVGAVNEVNSKLTTVNDESITAISNYFTNRTAFKIVRNGKVAIIVSYIQITTQVPANTEFATLANNYRTNDSLIFINTNTGDCVPVMVSAAHNTIQTVDKAMPTGYYRVVGTMITYD